MNVNRPITDPGMVPLDKKDRQDAGPTICLFPLPVRIETENTSGVTCFTKPTLWEKALNAASQNDLQVAKTKQNWHWLTGLSPCTGLFHLFAELVKYLDHLTDQFLVIVFATNGLGHAAPQVILKDHG